MDPATAVLELREVSKAFRIPGSRQWTVAVDHVSLAVFPMQTLALVGESGSGKSTVARLGLRLIPPDSGQILLLGEQVDTGSASQFRRTWRVVQPVFQDPVASFNPRRRVLSTMRQALAACGTPRDQLTDRTCELLEQVGLYPAGTYLRRWPHELSGGQRQRLAIARAIAVGPTLVIADEPVTGADVSIRGQLLNLLLDLQESSGVAYLFITHDIKLAREFADRVAVMQSGRIVEEGPTGQVLEAPTNDYTKRLLSATLV